MVLHIESSITPHDAARLEARIVLPTSMSASAIRRRRFHSAEFRRLMSLLGSKGYVLQRIP
jgi:hypothetical protein